MSHNNSRVTATTHEASYFAIILYIVLMHEMGQYCDIVFALGTFGIRIMKVSFMCSMASLPSKKYEIMSHDVVLDYSP